VEWIAMISIDGKRQDSREEGAILVWMALMMVVLLGIGALAVDLGYAYAVKRQLSSTADSAALAGAQEAGMKFRDPLVQGCGPALDSLVEDAVKANYSANAPQGGLDDPAVEIDCFGPDNVTPASGLNAASVVVRVDTESSLDTFLGRVLGASTLEPAATATARVFGSQTQTGLRPFLVCLDDAQEAKKPANAGDLFQSFYAQPKSGPKDTGGTEYSGTWGTNDELRIGNNPLAVNDPVWVTIPDDSTVVPKPAGVHYVAAEGGNGANAWVKLKRSKAAASLTVDITTAGQATISPLSAVGGGSSTWQTSGTVNEPGHGLQTGDRVWVAVTTGSPTDGEYVVTKVDNDNFTLTKLGEGAPTSPTISAATIDVFALSSGLSGECNPSDSPANWGYSAFDYPPSGSNNNSLDCLIEFGYGGGNACADYGAPGVNLGDESTAVPAGGDNGNNLQQDSVPLMEGLIGKEILLPVGNNWNGAGGNNAEYDGRGGLAVEFCGFAMPSRNVYRLGGPCASQSDYDQAVLDGRVTSKTMLVIQWRYISYFTGVYFGQDASESCRLGDCLPTVQMLQ
jgi:Flp pilus assembly protein TadG